MPLMIMTGNSIIIIIILIIIIINMKLNNLRKIICLRNSEVNGEIKTVILLKNCGA